MLWVLTSRVVINYYVTGCIYGCSNILQLASVIFTNTSTDRYTPPWLKYSTVNDTFLRRVMELARIPAGIPWAVLHNSTVSGYSHIAHGRIVNIMAISGR